MNAKSVNEPLAKALPNQNPIQKGKQMKTIKKTLSGILLTMLYLLSLFSFALADHDPYAFVDQMDAYGMQQQLGNMWNQSMNQNNQRLEQGWAQAIAWYRQQTGDYQSSDELVKQYAMNQYYEQNPQALQSELQFSQQQFEARQAAQNGVNETFDTVIVGGWQANQATLDQSMSKYSTYVTQGNAYYKNQGSGETFTLPYTSGPGYYQINGYDFYKDDVGQYWQHNGGAWLPLDPYNP